MGKSAVADIAFFAGTGSLGVGLWWIEPAYAMIGVGLIFTGLALFGAIRGHGGDGEGKTAGRP